jgi:hypothetical protein
MTYNNDVNKEFNYLTWSEQNLYQLTINIGFHFKYKEL